MRAIVRRLGEASPWRHAAGCLLLVLLLAPVSYALGGPLGLFLTVGALPFLIAQRRYPVLGGLGVVVLATVAFATAGGRQPPPVVLVLSAVVLVWLRRFDWPAVIATVAAGATFVLVAYRITEVTNAVGERIPLTVALLMLGGLLSAAVLTGSVLRVRSAYLAQVEARARQLEIDRDQRARIAVAGERQRIAREMHDVVAHSLTVIVRLSEGLVARGRAHGLSDAAGRDTERVALQALADTGRQSLGEMRRLLTVLGDNENADGTDDAGPPQLVPQPGIADLDALVDRVRAAGVAVSVTRSGTLDGWGGTAELAVYRIVQEALTNVLKHAGPGAAAVVAIRADGARLEVTVDDDGVSSVRSGSGSDALGGADRGLVGMTERAAAWGGELAAGPRPSGGWRVRAVLPAATDSVVRRTAGAPADRVRVGEGTGP